MRIFLREPLLQALFGLAFAVLLFALFSASYRLNHTNAFLILHFDAYRGIDLFGGIAVLYQLLSIGFLAVFLNYVISSILYARARFFAYVIAAMTFFYSVLLFIAISVIIVVN